MDSFRKVIASGPAFEMSKFRKHTIEEMRKRSKTRKQRKKISRKRVEGVGHSSVNEKEANEGTANVEKEWSNEEKGNNCIEEDKIDCSLFNGNSHE